MEAPSEKNKGPLDLSKVLHDRQIVKVVVGKEHTQFYVHKGLLVYYSDYFEKALSGSGEKAEGEIELDDVEPGLFSIFVEWTYTQKIPFKKYAWINKFNSTHTIRTEQSVGSFRSQLANLIRMKAYVLGDRLLATTFRNAVNNAYVNFNYKLAPYYNIVIYAFENIPSGRPILDFLVDTHVARWSKADDEQPDGEVKLRMKLPTDFLVRVMLRYDAVKGKTVDEIRASDYHEHASELEKEG